MARTRGTFVEIAIIQVLLLCAGAGAVFFGLRRAAALPATLALTFICIIIVLWKLAKSAKTSKPAAPSESVEFVRVDVPKVAAQSRPPTVSERLHALDWYQFQRLLEVIYKEKGYMVERLEDAKLDGGVDFMLRLGVIELGVRCKHWKSWMVGAKELREFLDALKNAGIENGRFIALKDFSNDAKVLARRHNVQLVSGGDLVKIMSEVNWEQNPAIQSILNESTKICPRCDSTMVLKTPQKGTRAGAQFWECSQYPKCDGTLTHELGSGKPLHRSSEPQGD